MAKKRSLLNISSYFTRTHKKRSGQIRKKWGPKARKPKAYKGQGRQKGENMRKVVIKCDNINAKQWSTFIIELNLICEKWRNFAKFDIESFNAEKIIKWGKKKGHKVTEEKEPDFK